MKKLIFLMAGVLLISGVSFSEEVKEQKSKLDFSGSMIEFRQDLYDSGDDDTSSEDTDMVLKLKYQIDEKTDVYLKYDTSDDDNGAQTDKQAELLIERKDGKLEAKLDAEFNLSGENELELDKDSNKTYIKYQLNEQMKLGFYPFNFGTSVGSELETHHVVETGGLGLDYKLNEDMTVFAGAASFDLEGENAFAYKLGMNYKKDKIEFKAQHIGRTEDGKPTGAKTKFADENGDTTKEYAITKSLTELALNYDLGMGNLYAELVLEELVDDNASGLFAKFDYKMKEDLVPYVSFTNLSEYFAYDDDQSAEKMGHGGLNKFEIGAAWTPEKDVNFTVTPYLEIQTAKNKIFTDGDKAVKDNTVLALKASYEF